MLVLTRRPSETVRIGTDIEVRVTRVEGNRVRLAISAPRSVRVVRGELAATESPLIIETEVCSIVA